MKHNAHTHTHTLPVCIIGSDPDVTCVSGDYHGSHEPSSGPGLCYSKEDAKQVPHQSACKLKPWGTKGRSEANRTLVMTSDRLSLTPVLVCRV